MPAMTTAQVLGQYRRALIEEGFRADVAQQMAAEAARLIIDDQGLVLGEGGSA